MAESNEGSDYDFLFKLVLIGGDTVGKSGFFLRITCNEFSVDTPATIGVAFATRELIIDGKKIKTQVWDISGQERSKSLVLPYCHDIDGIIAVFSLSDSESLKDTVSWVEVARRDAPPDLSMILIGNKCDLVDQREVSHEQAIALAEQLNVPYMETSALNASNIERAFNTLVTNIYKKKIKPEEDGPILTDPVSSKSKVEISSSASEKCGCCCKTS